MRVLYVPTVGHRRLVSGRWYSAELSDDRSSLRLVGIDGVPVVVPFEDVIIDDVPERIAPPSNDQELKAIAREVVDLLERHHISEDVALSLGEAVRMWLYNTLEQYNRQG